MNATKSNQYGTMRQEYHARAAELFERAKIAKDFGDMDMADVYSTAALHYATIAAQIPEPEKPPWTVAADGTVTVP